MNQQPNQHPHKSLRNCMVVIPAHDEAQDIAWVVGEIQKFSSFPVVVVDDASSDDTVSNPTGVSKLGMFAAGSRRFSVPQKQCGFAGK